MKYYKNGNRLTAVIDNNSFVQVIGLRTTTSIKMGNNSPMIDDWKQCDVEATSLEFYAALLIAQTDLQKKLLLIESLRDEVKINEEKIEANKEKIESLNIEKANIAKGIYHYSLGVIFLVGVITILYSLIKFWS